MNRFINTFSFTLFLFTLLIAAAVTGSAQKVAPETLNVCDFNNNVEVEATGGVNAGYVNLTAAFNAINLGLHTGSINIELCQSTFEPTSATLNSSGAGFASYTRVGIYPIRDNVSIEGNPAAGFGIIQLNGADNVTIEGDNPNTPGGNRNLAIHNTNGYLSPFGSLIRIATQPGGASSADNIEIRHLLLLGSVNNGNTPAAAVFPAVDASFGIYVGGGGGATPTDPPTAITSVTGDPAFSGTTVNNFYVNDNVVNQVGRGIVFNAGSSNVSDLVTIINNDIGDQGNATPATPPFTSPVTTVYARGIWVAGTNSYIVTGNNVKNIMSYLADAPTVGIDINGGIGSGEQLLASNNVSNIAQNSNTATSVRGIFVGSSQGPYRITRNNVSNVQGVLSGNTPASYVTGIEVDPGNMPPAGMIERNFITGVINNNVTTAAARGLDIGSGLNITIRNNMISKIITNQTNGHNFTTDLGLFGLRIAGGTGHKVYHNSVHLTGPMPGTANTQLFTVAFGIATLSSTGIDVRNNIFSNLIQTGNFPSANVCMYLPENADFNFDLTTNYNELSSGINTSREGILQVGLIPFTHFFTASTFNPNNTSSPNNMRTYTFQLSGAGTNDDHTVTFDPQFVSATNPHILPISQLIDIGDPAVGVVRDYDNQFRVGIPDIGADEPGGMTPFLIDIAATAFITPANVGLVSVGSTLAPQATFTNQGTSTINDIDVHFIISGPGGYSYDNVVHIPAMVTEEVRTITFASAPTFNTTGGYTMQLKVVNPFDQNAANDIVNGTFAVVAPLNGAYNVPGDFPSLTNAGGVFDALNAQGTSGNVTINVTADLTAETGAVALNQITGGHTVFVQASGAPRTISGDAPNSLIQLNGADGVTFSGLAFGDPRGLTIRNESTISGRVFLIYNDASNNAILNCNVEQSSNEPAIQFSFANTTGNIGNTVSGNLIHGLTAAGPLMNSGVLVNSASTVAPNKGLSVVNNEIYDFSQNGLALAGGNENLNVSGNLIRGDSTDRNTPQVGITIVEAQGTNLISGNTIRSMRTTVNAGTNISLAGIILGDVRNTTVRANLISDLRAQLGSTGRVVGIQFNGASGTPASATVVNNMIELATAANLTNSRFLGMVDNGKAGNTINYTHNSVYLRGQAGNQPSWSFLREDGVASALTLRNNIIVNNRFGNTAYNFAGGDHAPNSGGFDSNENYFRGRGLSGLDSYMDLGIDPDGNPVTGTQWTTGPAVRDSLSSFGDITFFSPDDVFVSYATGNLHLRPTAGPQILGAGGVTNVTVTDDFDGDPRNTPMVDPDRGADELVKTHGAPMPAGNYFNVMFVPGDQIGGDVTVRGILNLGGVTTPANVNAVLTLECSAYTNGFGDGNYIAAKVRRNFCGDNLYDFPVGAGTGSSPLLAVTTAGTTYPSSLTVNAVDDFLPGILQPTGASRYWTVEETGNVIANIYFVYRNEDVNGNEADYKMFRRSGGTTVAYSASTPDPTNNYVYAQNVSTFSDWGIGALAPTAASGNISGRISTAGGIGIRNVTVMVSGPGLLQRRTTVTGSLGYYTLTDLPVGQEYVVTVKSNRFHFANPSRIVTLNDSVAGLDFVAELQE